VNSFGAIEYRERPEPSLLVCAGTGLMLSLMDQCPRLRWCIDADGLSRDQQSAFSDWLTRVAPQLHLIAFAGWYCSTDPRRIAQALRRLNGRFNPVYAQCHGPGDDHFDDLLTAFDLAQLVTQINGYPAASPRLRALSWEEYTCSTP
jgi:hypothetical protein